MKNGYGVLLLMERVAGVRAVDFYVNDTQLESDVYCMAIGDDANDGPAMDRPMLNLAVLLTNYSFQADDTGWMNPGHYTLSDIPFVENIAVTNRPFSALNAFRVNVPLTMIFKEPR